MEEHQSEYKVDEGASWCYVLNGRRRAPKELEDFTEIIVRMNVLADVLLCRDAIILILYRLSGISNQCNQLCKGISFFIILKSNKSEVLENLQHSHPRDEWMYVILTPKQREAPLGNVM